MKTNELKNRINAFAADCLQRFANFGPRREIVFGEMEQANCKSWCKRNGIKATAKNIEARAREIDRQDILNAIRVIFMDRNPEASEAIEKFGRIREYIEEQFSDRAEEIVNIWYAC